jgi:hypothetical protein
MLDFHIYRLLLIGYLVSIGVALFRTFFVTPEWPRAAIQYFHWRRENALGDLEVLSSYVGMGAMALSVLGALTLLAFWRPGRYIFTAGVLVLVLVELVPETPYLATSVGMFVDSAAALAAGGVLAMSFSGPVAERLGPT